jgi:hypothetical protein
MLWRRHVDTTIIKLVDVQYSNSMIEAFWRIMKTNGLYLNKLDSFAAVEKQVNFYIDQYNRVIPHSAHSGQTPDEIYFKTGTEVPSELQAAAVKARVARRETNLTTKRCQSCQPQPPLVQIESQPSTRSPPPTCPLGHHYSRLPNRTPPPHRLKIRANHEKTAKNVAKTNLESLKTDFKTNTTR